MPSNLTTNLPPAHTWHGNYGHPPVNDMYAIWNMPSQSAAYRPQAGPHNTDQQPSPVTRSFPTGQYASQPEKAKQATDQVFNGVPGLKSQQHTRRGKAGSSTVVNSQVQPVPKQQPIPKDNSPDTKFVPPKHTPSQQVFSKGTPRRGCLRRWPNSRTSDIAVTSYNIKGLQSNQVFLQHLLQNYLLIRKLWHFCVF